MENKFSNNCANAVQGDANAGAGTVDCPRYDLVVIGGGPGGYTGAIRAAKLGMKVALLEEKELGGTCLNRGCIPTKALLRSSEIFSSRIEWDSLGINADNVSIDQTKVYARKDNVVSNLRKGVESLIRANKIDLYKSRGVIVDKNTVVTEDKKLQTKFILVATGSRPAEFDPSRPIAGIETALNSDDVLEKPFEGESLIIVGAGVIGVEFATYYAGLGKSVTIIAPSERIIKMMSCDMSTQLTAVLKKQGVKIVVGAKIRNVTSTSVSFEANEKNQELRADGVLVAIGRMANVKNLGLENVGVAMDKVIFTDKNKRTSIDNIFACGDCAQGVQLAHYAAASAIIAVESMLGMPHSLNLDIVPSCIYTFPEIASVGKKEEEVDGAKVGKFMMGANGKSSIEGISRGFIKVIADSDDTVVGAEVFAVRGTDIIGEIALAISAKMKVHDISRVIHAHPTVYEAVGEACEDIHGLATHLMPKA